MPIVDPNKLPAGLPREPTPTERYAQAARELRALVSNHEDALAFLTMPEWPLCFSNFSVDKNESYVCEKPRGHAGAHTATTRDRDTPSRLTWDDAGTLARAPITSTVWIDTKPETSRRLVLVDDDGKGVDAIDVLFAMLKATKRGLDAGARARDRITRVHSGATADAAATVYDVTTKPFADAVDRLERMLNRAGEDTGDDSDDAA